MTKSQQSHPPIMHVWKADAPLFTRIADMIRHPTGKKLIKYSAVSVISTTVSQLTLLLVFGVFHLLSPVPANIVANVVATVPSYTLNRRWVWGKSGRSHILREVTPFWVLSFVGLGLSSVLVWAAGQFAHHHGLHHFGTAVLVNAANLFAFGTLWILKFIIFNKLFHIEPIEYNDDEPDLVEA